MLQVGIHTLGQRLAFRKGIEKCSRINTCGRGRMKSKIVRQGKVGIKYSLNNGQSPQGILKVGGSFQFVTDCSEKAKPLYPQIDQSLEVGYPQKRSGRSVTLGYAALSNQEQFPKKDDT